MVWIMGVVVLREVWIVGVVWAFGTEGTRLEGVVWKVGNVDARLGGEVACLVGVVRLVGVVVFACTLDVLVTGFK